MVNQDEEWFWAMWDVGSCIRFWDTTCKGYFCWDRHTSNLAEEGSPCKGSYHSVYQIRTHHQSCSSQDLQQSMGPPCSRIWPNRLRLTDALVPSPDQTVTTQWQHSHSHHQLPGGCVLPCKWWIWDSKLYHCCHSWGETLTHWGQAHWLTQKGNSSHHARVRCSCSWEAFLPELLTKRSWDS